MVMFFWPGCAKKVDDWRWGCGEHWHILPAGIRERIESKVTGAELDAETWIRGTFGADIKERWDRGKWERLVRWVRDRDAARALRTATTVPQTERPT